MERRRGGFTLIELLTVIAILAVLMAILLPTLNRARATAKTSVCLSNLRQLSHGWHMYADDNRAVLLPGRYAKAPGGTANPDNWYEIGNGLKYRPRWVATMGRYVGLYAFDQPRTDSDRQEYSGSVYQCPAVPEWINERNYAYGYNHQFLGNARKTNGRFHNFPVQRHVIKNMAGTVLAADCMGTAAGVSLRARRPYDGLGSGFAERGNHGWTLDPPRLTEFSDRGTGDEGSPRTAVDPRHVGQSNVIFCDGHGDKVTPQSLGYRVLDDGTFADGAETPGVEADPPTNRFFAGTGKDQAPPPLPTP